jgi:hypothetical protein
MWFSSMVGSFVCLFVINVYTFEKTFKNDFSFVWFEQKLKINVKIWFIKTISVILIYNLWIFVLCNIKWLLVDKDNEIFEMSQSRFKHWYQ